MRSTLAVLAAALLLAPMAILAEGEADVPAQIKAFKEAMKSKDEEARLAAVTAIAPTKHKDIAAALAGQLRDHSPKVRAAIGKALGAQGDQKYRSKLMAPMKKYEKEDPVVLVGYLEGLEGLPHRSSIDPLVKMVNKIMNRLKEEEQPVGIGAVKALGKIREKEAISELIVLLGRTNPRAGGGGNVSELARSFCGAFKAPIIEGLSYLTGQQFKDPDVWTGWWKEEEKRFKMPTGEEDLNASIWYENSGYRFKVKRANEKWQFFQPTSENYVITVGHPQENNETTYDAFLSVEAYSTSAYASSSPADRVAFYEQWAHDKGFKDVKESSTRDVTFAGEKAKLWMARGMSASGTILSMRKYFLVHNGLLFSIHVQELSGIPEALQEDLKAVEQSFRFTK